MCAVSFIFIVSFPFEAKSSPFGVHVQCAHSLSLTDIHVLDFFTVVFAADYLIEHKQFNRKLLFLFIHCIVSGQ